MATGQHIVERPSLFSCVALAELVSKPRLLVTAEMSGHDVPSDSSRGATSKQLAEPLPPLTLTPNYMPLPPCCHRYFKLKRRSRVRSLIIIIIIIRQLNFVRRCNMSVDTIQWRLTEKNGNVVRNSSTETTS